MFMVIFFLLFFGSTCEFANSEEVSMGTTIVAVRFRDGVVVGADSRTSVSGYVSNRYATKISFVLEDDFRLKLDLPSKIQMMSSLKSIKIDESLSDVQQRQASVAPSSTCCICRSGSAADTQYLADTVRHQMLKRRILHRSTGSISNVAHLIKNYLYNNDLQASLICAGYDHIRGEGVIYSIDLGGTIIEQPYYSCSGSGSGYIIGYMDDHLSKISRIRERYAITEDEAIELVGNSIELAMDRDGSSGGLVRMFVINRNGKRELLRSPRKNQAAVGDANDTLKSILSKFAPALRP
mmetsp:Transcript_9882/g.18590  ORF Transcript_9882/g.18590 Transcript_9882/m.18590 type:complete len:295 (-) Transcript_9882:127-1011(-)